MERLGARVASENVQRYSRQSQSPRFFFQSDEGAIAMTLASAFPPNIDVADVRDAANSDSVMGRRTDTMVGSFAGRGASSIRAQQTVHHDAAELSRDAEPVAQRALFGEAELRGEPP